MGGREGGRFGSRGYLESRSRGVCEALRGVCCPGGWCERKKGHERDPKCVVLAPGSQRVALTQLGVDGALDHGRGHKNGRFGGCSLKSEPMCLLMGSTWEKMRSQE